MNNNSDSSDRSTVLQFGCGQQHQQPEFYSSQPSQVFTFHRQFEQQVQSSPDRIAVWAKDAPDTAATQWTYQRLNQEANAIARRLMDAGVGVEDVVGLVMDRRACLLAAMIGIMKAGARYVGLEPAQPVDRLAFMTRDANLKAIVTEKVHVARSNEIVSAAEVGAAKVDSAIEVINWDSDAFNTFRQSLGDKIDKNPNVEVNSRNGAYLIYTSGSTGKPKGVDVWHHSFVNFCTSFAAVLELSQADTCLAITTITFDVSIAELFPLLLLGGTVALGSKQVGANGQQLSALIEEVSATYLCATPTSLRILVASGWQESPQLTVVAGGEPVSALVCNEVGPKVRRIINGYGPTEGTVYTTLGNLSADQMEPVPIGPPILNSRLYVLDDEGKLVPPLAEGKLFIGGQSPARGYWNRPELTAEKFVDDPFVDPEEFPDAKMYNSGDTVYWREDGILQYVGRSDQQVKLRGYRIELGEIEAKLNAHRSVKDSVVIVREDTPGQQRLVAYVIFDSPVSDQVLQDHVADALPDYMVPSWFVELESFPTNANFKLDRKALPDPDSVKPVHSDRNAETEETAAVDPAGEQKLAADIAIIWSEILNRKIRVDDRVFRMGADSLRAVKFQIRLEEDLGQKISIGEVFQYPTPLSLAAQLQRHLHSKSKSSHRSTPKTAIRDIAIVGMAGRFPGAANVDEFWDNLVNGVESVREFTEEELIEAGVAPSEYLHANYIRRGTVLDDAYEFEPEFFGITRNDAEIVSPQIRLFMKTVWEALEQAGYPVEPADNRIGVFAGGGLPNYLAPFRHVPEAERLQRLIGNGADFMATRTSYSLGLTGPAVGIQTACSSSLVAVANAVDAIRAGKCEMAIAGGSSFSWPHEQGYQHGEGLIYSADGHCRAFDHRATGTLFSQAAGAVLLRPLEDAIASGDTIHAVIKGVAVNNDGNRKGGYASPSIAGQTEVIRMALDDAAISAEQISLMEAHGTGTKIGDPIEVSGLNQAWTMDTDKKNYCALGSVKANVGHADAAAGIVGLLKLVMSLKHRKIAPLINYEKPNPEIDLDSTPFYISGEAKDWDVDGDVRFAAVSSFGMGGTNAHAVLTEGQSFGNVDSNTAPPQTTGEGKQDTEVPAAQLQLIPFSARTNESLSRMVENFAASKVATEFDLNDVGHTLRYGRKHFKRRSFAVVDSGQQLQDSLDDVDCDAKPALRRKVVFMFTGQGAQYAEMAKELFEREPVFRTAIRRCDEVLKSAGEGLIDWLFNPETLNDINQTQYSQLALFSISYAQTKLWQSWGVEPDALIGHSIGECVAAAISGVMKLEDALVVVKQRGRLMQNQPTGSMLAVMHKETPIESLLELPSANEIDLAVVNSPAVAVVSGEDDAIDSFAKELDLQGVKSKVLHTSHAFHSRMMDSMLDPFLSAFDGVQLSEPTIPYLSNVTGTWITNEQATDSNYFASQIRSTVRFAYNLQTLFADEDDLLLIEMGPGSTLTQLAKSQFAGQSHVAIATLPSAKESNLDSQRFTWNALGKAWAAGLELDWSRLQPASFDQRRRRVPLPTYPFDEQTYRAKPERIGAAVDDNDDDQWFNVPSWRQCFPIDRIVEADIDLGCDQWLLFVHDQKEAKRIKQQLGDVKVVTVLPGDQFSQKNDSSFTIRPGREEDCVKLLESIDAAKNLAGVVHAWSVKSSVAKSADDFWRPHEISSFNVAWLSKAIGECVLDRMVPLNILTTGICSLDPSAKTIPANHCHVGAASVIQKEYRCLATKVIDVGQDPANAIGIQDFGRLLKSNHHERLLAIDRGQWWSMDFEQVELLQADHCAIDDGAVIVFTGGLGGLARNMAIEFAAEFSNLSIAMLVRTPLPEESTWDSLLTQDDDANAELRSRIADVRRLREICNLEIFPCDVSRADEVSLSLDLVKQSFGKIDALFHTAGILNDGIVATRTDELIRPVFESKSLAADNISNAVLKNHADVKCVAFFSSISADLGMFGQFAYSAANNYLDGLCQLLNSEAKASTQFFTINWPAFREVGMAVRTSTNLAGDAALMKEMADNSFTVAEGAAAMLSVINNGRHHRVAISKRAFTDRLALAIEDSNSVAISKVDSDQAAQDNGVNSDQDRMLEIWRQQFGNDELDLDVDYFELGGDSLMAVGMIAAIESRFGTMLPISHLINSPTPRKLIKKLGLGESVSPSEETLNKELLDKSSSSSFDRVPDHVICLREGTSSESPLFLIHGADGSVLFYRDFAKRLNTDRTIYAVESPSISEAGWHIPDTVEEVAAEYLKAIRTVQPRGPYWIAGYSFGGVATFEIARQMEDAGDEIETALLYDIPNPSIHTGTLTRIKNFWDRQEDSVAPMKVAKLTKRTLKAVRDRAKTEIENRIARGKSEESGSAFWRHRKTRERHMQIEESYVPQRLQGPLRVVSATGNGSKFRVDEHMGWRVVSDNLKVREVPGVHLELFNEEYVGGMLESTEFFLEEFKR